MSLWETVTWDVARAGGFTAYILLTLSVLWGLALTLHWQTPRWPRIINSELHNFLTLLALIFTGIHVLAVWIDPFTNFGWNEILIPFASHYRPVWMAFGIVALYLGLAIGLSTWLRPYIGYKWWRRFHVLTLLLFALVAVHGIATGSDTHTWWGATIYIVSLLSVGILTFLRLYKPANEQSRAHPVFAWSAVAGVLMALGWILIAPLQAGWNALFNHGLGSMVSAATKQLPSGAVNPQQQQTSFTPSFNGQVQGQMTQQGPDGNGNVTMNLNMNIVNGPQGTVQVMLKGQNTGNEVRVISSQITLGSTNGTSLYSGSLTALSGNQTWHMLAVLQGTGSGNSTRLQVQLDVRVSHSGQVFGSIVGNTYNGQPQNNGSQPQTTSNAQSL